MNWRIENKVDFYDTLVKWWEEHKFPILPLKSLPENIFIAFDESGDIAAIPTYRSDSDFFYLGFITVKKEANIRKKAIVLPFLIDAVSETMRNSGFDRILITCNIPGLMKNLEKAGFKNMEKTNYFVKIL